VTWVVTGAAGQLGRDVVEVLTAAGHSVRAMSSSDLDVRDPDRARAGVEGADVVVNAAAWTDVDGAESDEAGAFAVNAVGAANVARACAEVGAELVHVSTDYVFDGSRGRPYRPADPMAPLNAYGRSKAAGEWAARAECAATYVVRTSWLFGRHGRNFVRTMLERAGQPGGLDVVADQTGQPTWTLDLATRIEALVTGDARPGVHHVTNSGTATWFELAQEVLTVAGLPTDDLRPASTSDHPRPAARPRYSVLTDDDLLPDWRDAVRRAVPLLLSADEG